MSAFQLWLAECCTLWHLNEIAELGVFNKHVVSGMPEFKTRAHQHEHFKGLPLMEAFRGKAGSSTSDSGCDRRQEAKPVSKEPAYAAD